MIQSYDFGIFLGMASLSAAVLWAIGAVSGVRECTKAGMSYFVPTLCHLLFQIFHHRADEDSERFDGAWINGG